MKKHLPTIAFGMIVVVAWMTAWAHEEKPIQWNFDKDPVGKSPPGWKIAFPVASEAKTGWRVASDPSAPSPPNVLVLQASQGDDKVFNLAMDEKGFFGDLELSVKLRADSGKDDQGGGLVWRAKDDKNYYVCRINPLEGNYRVYKVVDGKRTQLQSADVKTEAGKWYTLGVTMSKNEIKCSLDGKTLLQASDDTFKEAGMVGVWTKADASTSFDNLSATLFSPPDQ